MTRPFATRPVLTRPVLGIGGGAAHAVMLAGAVGLPGGVLTGTVLPAAKLRIRAVLGAGRGLALGGACCSQGDDSFAASLFEVNGKSI